MRRVLHCKKQGRAGSGAGRVRAGGQGGEGMPGDRIPAGSGYHRSTGTAPHHHPHPPAPTQAGMRPWVLLPAPPLDPPPYLGRAGGYKGFRSPSMMPHLVLRPSTRLPFTWCSWSAPTTAKGIFSCRRRGARSPQGAAGLPRGGSLPHHSPQGPASPIPASRHSPESCRSAPCHPGPGRSPPAGTR